MIHLLYKASIRREGLGGLTLLPYTGVERPFFCKAAKVTVFPHARARARKSTWVGGLTKIQPSNRIVQGGVKTAKILLVWRSCIMYETYS